MLESRTLWRKPAPLLRPFFAGFPMPNKIARICVVGSSNMDLTFRTSRLPRAGETVSGGGFHLGFGGKGANQAVMAARLWARVTMIAKIGGDNFGEQMTRNFQEQNIDTEHLLVDGSRPSGVAGIVVDDNAQNCIIVVPGANDALSPADVHAAAASIQSADVLLCQLEVPLETTLEAFRLARAAGVRTVLNPAPARSLPEELLHLTDLCVPNETEIEAITGQVVTNLKQARTAARTLRVPNLIVTLGDQGALLVAGDVEEHVPAVPVEAVDTSGAGDAFIGSLAVFWARGHSLLEAVRKANAVAALSVTRHGTQAAFPTRAELAT
jgi:ribokinase